MRYITLLSDFGLQDASVAIAKGILIQHTHGLGLIDITHEITPFNTLQAAYLLGAAYKSFPSGTCHVLLFDLFSEKTPSLLLSEHDGHYFLSPDNEVIPLSLGTMPANVWQCMTFKKSATFTDWLNAIGNAINLLQARKTEVSDLPPYKLKALPENSAQNMDANIIECEVIHIDHYENVVINIIRQRFETLARGRQFRLQFMRVEEINEVSNNYNDVRQGYKLCRFNSNDYLEICINRGKAASLFGLRLGSRNNDVKIFFE